MQTSLIALLFSVAAAEVANFGSFGLKFEKSSTVDKFSVGMTHDAVDGYTMGTEFHLDNKAVGSVSLMTNEQGSFALFSIEGENVQPVDSNSCKSGTPNGKPGATCQVEVHKGNYQFTITSGKQIEASVKDYKTGKTLPVGTLNAGAQSKIGNTFTNTLSYNSDKIKCDKIPETSVSFDAITSGDDGAWLQSGGGDAPNSECVDNGAIELAASSSGYNLMLDVTKAN